MFSFTGLTVIAQSLLLIFDVIPESPTSLIEAGNLKQAIKVLAIFNTDSVLDNVFSEYIKLSRRNKFIIRYRKKNTYHHSKSENNVLEMSSPQGMSANTVVLNIKDDFEVGNKKNKDTVLVEPSFNKNISNSDSYSI